MKAKKIKPPEVLMYSQHEDCTATIYKELPCYLNMSTSGDISHSDLGPSVVLI
jgi:hypothetical protein